MNTKSRLLTILLLLGAGATPAAESSFSSKPTARKTGAKHVISFAVSRKDGSVRFCPNIPAVEKALG